jgi:ATP-dependent Clp protease adapter protein ClpS
MSGDYWDDNEDPGGGADGRAGTKTVTRTKKPSLYRVLILNDD